MRTWCLVEHLVSGRVSVGEYDHCRGELWIGGELVPLRPYWAVARLGPGDALRKAVPA